MSGYDSQTHLRDESCTDLHSSSNTVQVTCDLIGLMDVTKSSIVRPSIIIRSSASNSFDLLSIIKWPPPPFFKRMVRRFFSFPRFTSSQVLVDPNALEFHERLEQRTAPWVWFGMLITFFSIFTRFYTILIVSIFAGVWLVPTMSVAEGVSRAPFR